MFSSANSVPCAPASRSASLIAASMALSLLAGCGGGGGGGGAPPPPPPPPPVNQAPAFTSAPSVTVIENIGVNVYRAAATDPEGSPVTFSISGGADAARFSITAAGELSFFTPPNFDLPTDGDLNNIYQVEIAASDGQVRSTRIVNVTVTNSKEGIAVHRVGTGFVDPTAAAVVTDNLLLIAEKNGSIYTFNGLNGSRQLLVKIAVSGQGVVAITPGNDFVGSGSFFVMYTNNGSLIVQEYRRNPAGPTVPNAFGPILTIPASDYAGGGWLGLDEHVQLLIATGDSGGSGDPTGSAQNDSSRLGKIIRAAENPDPFAGASPSFYILSNIAKGLHQPAGGYVYDGGLLIGDRGESVADEVDLLPRGQSGFNFGWPFKEGFRTVRGTPPPGVVDPVTEYLRIGGAAVQGNVGGVVASNAIESIAVHYVFADRSGAIFSFPTTSLQNARTATERRTADFAPDVGAIDQPIAVIRESTGHIFIVDADGDIFRVDAG
jgi:hypothetical protein